MTDVKEKLTTILKEHKALKEEVSMKRLKENEANKDSQTSPSIPGASGPSAKANPSTASQDDLAKKYAENEADKDTQATPSTAGASGSGKYEPGVGQDGGVADDLKKDTKMESEGSEVKKEAEVEIEVGEDEEEDKESERFKEFEGDMTKMVEILEALKGKVDALEEKMAKMEGGASAAPAEKPEPPMTESKRLSNSFVEAVNVSKSDVDKRFTDTVKSLLA